MNNTVNLTVEYVPVNQIKPAKYQPDVRTEERFLKELIESIKENGFWQDSFLRVTKNYVLIDGHRRLAASKHLGMDTVPCFVVNEKPDVRYAWMNSTSRAFTSKEELEAYSKGLKVIPPKHKKVMAHIIEVGGMELIMFLASVGVSPRIIYQAENVARYVGKPDDNDFTIKVVEWLVKWKLQYIVRAWISVLHVNPNKLLDRIQKDQVPDFA